MAEKADRGLAAAAEETGSSFHQRKKQKSGPSARPLMLPRTRLQRLNPGGRGGGLGYSPTEHHGVWAHKGAGLHSAHLSSSNCLTE